MPSWTLIPRSPVVQTSVISGRVLLRGGWAQVPNTAPARGLVAQRCPVGVRSDEGVGVDVCEKRVDFMYILSLLRGKKSQ
jgi:hypothetical protein